MNRRRLEVDEARLVKIGLNACAATLAALWGLPALAASTVDAAPYVGIAGIYQSPDTTRQAKDGLGFRGWAGLPLTEHGAVELSAMLLERSRHDDGDDHVTALFADYVYDFGNGPGKPASLPGFKPYLLAGAGISHEKSFGHLHNDPALEAGGGLLFPLRFGSWDWGWALRTEIRVIAEHDDHAFPSHSVPVDFNVDAGINVPLTWLFGSAHSEIAQPECPVAVVPIDSKPRDCPH